MPQRFLRPGIRTSEAWNKATWFEQSLYVRLLTLVDDEGRYDGRIPIIHSECFALRDDVNRQLTAAAGSRLSELGLVDFYEVDGKQYLQLTKWQERVRNHSKYPGPENGVRQPSAAIGSQILPPSPVPSPSPSPIPHSAPDGNAGCVTKALPSVTPSPTPPTIAPSGAVCSPPKSGIRVKPSEGEAELYASKIGLPMSEVPRFFDYYESNGWKVGKNPMRSWQGAMRNWKRNWEDRRNQARRNGTSEHRVDVMSPEERTAAELREIRSLDEYAARIAQ